MYFYPQRVYLAQEPEGNQPSVSEARWKLGLALQAQGRITDALAEFRESVRLNPESKAAQELKRLRSTVPANASKPAGDAGRGAYTTKRP